MEARASAGGDRQPCVLAGSKRTPLYTLLRRSLPACLWGLRCLPLSLWTAELLPWAAWVLKLCGRRRLPADSVDGRTVVNAPSMSVPLSGSPWHCMGAKG